MKNVMNEIWKSIDGYPNYMVSNMGNVKNVKTNLILKWSLFSGGYYGVVIRNGNKKHSFTIHKLVATHFLPNPENKPCVDHINGDRTDNRAENLRWTTHKENMNNPITKNRLSKVKRIEMKNKFLGVVSKEHPASIPILQFTKDGEFIRKWDCISDVKKQLKIDNGNIGECCRGKRKTAGNYKWGYADDYEQIQFNVFDLIIYRKKVV